MFVAEDGTGLSTSTSYISVAYADTYHSDMGHVSWTSLSTPEKETMLIRASKYIDKRFGRRFRGTRIKKDQTLQWPRVDAYDNDDFTLTGVPKDLKEACAEYALRAAIYSELAPDPVLPVPTQDFGGAELPTPATEQSQGAISSKTEIVFGAVEESVSYRGPDSQTASGKENQSTLVNTGNIPEYPAADLLIENLLENQNFQISRG